MAEGLYVVRAKVNLKDDLSVENIQGTIADGFHHGKDRCRRVFVDIVELGEILSLNCRERTARELCVAR